MAPERYEDYVWNVWAEQSGWSTPGLLLRLVAEEERRTVASQIEQDVVAGVEQMNEHSSSARTCHDD